MTDAERLILRNQALILKILQQLLSTPGVWGMDLNTTDARVGRTITPINAQIARINLALKHPTD